ncbi:ABC transporter ATP-binding protein [Roseospira marina]|uniref:ABC transporter ATP-binding protein n=1 Tax=Roseospira marina TaxID=140057 RepID=A0A5M6IA72_9PROT|nr:ABC transporter ATP-binding protein [Roseospira marina]KAA5605174.1 ABC transporter ATP-binding protein [Roseospira marina]MBB4314931.1 branched-chain amino acid transport system ATP-binding protein [Roseospira marina]MBB5087931.1 branched-chain amino acid transport system ATP-binding protein [Roseospira marina]
MTEAVLEVRGLNAWYGRAHILFDVDLTVRRGEVVALLGRNGAGKTTTFASLMGLVPSVTGSATFDGAAILGRPTHEIAGRGLGYVPEDRRIFTDLTVDENLMVGERPPRDGVPHWTPAILYDLFPNLAELRRRPGGHMSGGEQQMLTIARTLMGNPSLVLLDEPSEGLAPRIVEQMANALNAMKREGVTLILSEQNLHFSRLISDRATIIEGGRIRFDGTFAELDAQPAISATYLAV